MIREQNLQVTDAPNMAYDAVLTAGNFKPILFSTPMVQAILRGEKTQTRRIINPQPIEDSESGYVFDGKHKSLYKNDTTHEDWRILFISDWCKYKIGDILWVRETWTNNGLGYYRYKADGTKPFINSSVPDKYRNKWKPSIFMPKEACRIFLKLKSIKIERLNKISGEDAMKEGVQVESMWPLCIGDAYRAYAILWDKINGKGAWDKNLFIWVYEFERTDASFACS